MKRRSFLKKTSLTAASAFAVPYILPSGRLFAKTGTTTANHVVFVLFAGGVRQQESMLKRYLAESQNLDIEGNIMYNILPGDAPEIKIVYGVDTVDGQPGGQPIDPILQTPLQLQGTLFPEVRYSTGGTGHYGGLVTGVSGYYGVTQGLTRRPLHPTIFEYLRRHSDAKGTDVWFIGNGIGNSVPLLNHSDHSNYGSQYGANFFAPTITFGDEGEEHLKGFKVYHPEEELDPMTKMRLFLNQNFSHHGGMIPNLNNTEEEKEDIKAFIKNTFERLDNGQINFPPIQDNDDLKTIGYATEVLKWFQPKLTVINMSSVDSCHSSYTAYLQSLHRADHAVGHLWKVIQNDIPAMADNTLMIVMPEHGRNYEPNGILDENDWFAFDHDGDANSRRIFTLMVGPCVEPNLIVGNPNNPIGEAADVVPTIADALGIKNEVMAGGLISPGAMSLFDRI